MLLGNEMPVTLRLAAAALAAWAAALAAAAPPPLPLWTAGELNVTLYRIPVLAALNNGTTLLAFAEARLPCQRSCGKAGVRGSWGDSSPKHVAFRRSTDAGSSWTATRFIVRSDGTNDNLNLGNVVVDRNGAGAAVLLQWGGCVHCSCTGTVPKPAVCKTNSHSNVKQIRSTDAGASWGSIEDISSQVLDSKLAPIFKLGEGSGVQLPTETGELVVCGRISSLGTQGCTHAGGGDAAKMGNCGSACIISSDGGHRWVRGGAVAPTAAYGDNECEPALLPNGSILLNMRAGAARLLARSDDGGRSFVDVHPALDLSPVANCQGSMATTADGSTLLFTAPAGRERRNLSLAVSTTTEGGSWEYTKILHNGPSAYSSLAPTSDKCAALLFEGGADAEASTYQHIYFTHVCA